MKSNKDRLEATLPAVPAVDLGDGNFSDSAGRDVFLVVMAGTSVGGVLPLKKAANLVGRDDDADVQVVDGGISRRHALISWDPHAGAFQCNDLGSRNGTSVNGRDVTAPRYLRRGDKIELGIHTILRVSFADEPETRYAQEMNQRVLRDGLTGIFNRRYFDERLASEVAFSARHGAPLSLLLADIDHFKQVNDEHDHQTGDAVLQQFAHQVERLIRTEDVLARYGGEEFTVICRDTDEEHAALLADRIREKVARKAFTFRELKLAVTVSIGVATTSETIKDMASLVEAADSALYKAKSGGRNQVVRYSTGD